MADSPIREAIIVPEPGDPLRPVAREPLLVRTILSLQRAGIERCTLVGSLPAPRDARIRCALVHAPALTPPADDALRLVVGTGTVIDPTLVRELQGRVRPGEVVVVEDHGARVRVAPGPRVAANGGALVRPSTGTLREADSAGLETALLGALENPRDGYLDRLIHRRVSRPLTRVLLRTSLSPNAVTLAGIVLGVAGGLLLARPGIPAVLGAIALLEVGAILDCSDGELARLRFAESRLGHWLDVVGDTLVHVAVFAGIALRIARAGEAPGWPALVSLLVGVAAAFGVITWSDESESRRRVPGWENRVLDGFLSPLTTRDWHLFPILFALAGRLDVLVPAAAVGAQVFWIVTLVILVRALRRAGV
jgi:phosphatidylglycerophosphate synthase